ncbi:MAG: TadE/TadG family type IV pilus assembly protein [Pseudonocardiaceae bacterium]
MGDRRRQRRAGIWRRLRSGRGPALLAEGTSSADARHGAGKSGRGEDGQAMVEFAIVLPLLLLLVTGIIQFGLLFNKYITLTGAVRSGARTLAVGRGLSNPCDPAVSQMIKSASSIGLTSAQVTPSFSAPSSDYCGAQPSTYVYNTSGNTGGNEIQSDQATVTATTPFTLSVFGMSVWQLNLTASASDGIE